MHHRIAVAAVLLLACIIGAGCSRQVKFTEQRYQMATVVELQVLAPPSREQAVRAAMSDAFAAMAKVEKTLSWFDKESEVARLRRAKPGEIVPVSQWTMECLTITRELNRATGGMYDVAAGRIIHLWGFGPGRTNVVPSDEAVADALRSSGMDKVCLLPDQGAVSVAVAGVEIDLSSIAAGFAVDRAAEALLERGWTNFLVNGGGELRMSSTGGKTWQIGIQAPDESATPDKHLSGRIIKLKNGAVSTSGSYRNYYKAGTNTFIHIVNPKTGRPMQTPVVSVTVWAEDCTTADAWSTALFTLPVGQALKLTEEAAGIECLIVERPAPGEKDFRFHYSKDFRKNTGM